VTKILNITVNLCRLSSLFKCTAVVLEQIGTLDEE
jgi:hypothetical protein